MNPRRIIVYIVVVIIMLLIVFGVRYLQAVVFYESDIRCVFAECRINK